MAYFKPLFIILALTFTFGLTGCEQLEGLKDKITGDDKKQEKMTQAPSEPKQMAEPKPSVPAMTPDTLARVGSWTITQQEFKERLDALNELLPEFDSSDPENRADVLEELIRQQLVVVDAENTGFAKQKDIIEAVEEFRRTLIVREKALELTEDITVTDQEAMQLFEENKDALISPLQLRVREIVLKDKQAAESLLIQILQGLDFAEAARQNSTAASATEGGDLGYLQEIPFPQMGNQLATLEEGDVSSVFSGPDGYYIIKVEERTGGEPLEYEDVKDLIIEQQTMIKQQQAVLQYIDGLRDKYKVDINEDLLR